MTLNTHIYLTGPIGARQAFETATSVILKTAGREGETAKVDPPRESWDGPGVELLSTVPGQGLPAWVMCHYRKDGPLAPVDQYDDDDDYEEEPYLIRPACDLELSWDTAYGYKDNGLSCTQLHVLALIELRRVLPAEVAMKWKNEYSGKINAELEGFEDFLGAGREAGSWFESIRPILEAAR